MVVGGVIFIRGIGTGKLAMLMQAGLVKFAVSQTITNKNSGGGVEKN